MRNYIILNNQNSNDISGLIIQELAPISKPQQRTQVETIDGRDGDIVTPLGYAAYNKKIKIGLYGDFDINEIIAYFATKGTAIFSNEPDKYYNYQILDQIDYERLVRFRVATVTMHVQPFKYSATEGTLTIDASDTVTGEGSDIALDGTAEAPFNVLRHKGNAIQNGTPTPDSPQDIKVLTGDSTVKITGKNLAKIFSGDRTYTKNGLVVNYTGGDTLTVTNNLSQGVGGHGAVILYSGATSEWGLTANTSVDDQKIGSAGNYYYGATISAAAPATSGATLCELQVIKTDGTTNTLQKITGRINAATTNFTFGGTVTLNAGEHIKAIGFYFQDIIFNNAKISLQLEAGSSASEFEPYKAQVYKLNLGKNLLDIDNIAVTNAYISNTGVETSSQTNLLTDYMTAYPSTAYTLSTNTTMYNLAFAEFDANKTFISRTSISATKANTITTNASTRYVRVSFNRNNITAITRDYVKSVEPQLELGSTATSYAPYFTPIELAAIGDYADEPVKVGDTWYIRHKIGKVVLDGTESGWTWADTARYAITTPNIGAREAISDHFTYVNYTGHATTESPSFDISSNLASIGFHNKDITSLNNFKTWLASNPTTVYYALATPTDEEITEQALIDQLDELYDQAHAYKGRTHITATAQGDNAPAVLAVEVNQDNETTVTNAGNTTSRPIITIYGQGNIGMYINDVQVLDIALGDEQYITIDSVAMEAYKDTTENLKNRLVTGDYNKLALNAGANKIYFTGNVTKYEISKYSRWL